MLHQIYIINLNHNANAISHNVINNVQHDGHHWVQGHALFPTCHHECVWCRNLPLHGTHPLMIHGCDRKYHYAWWVADSRAFPFLSCAPTRLCSGGIVLQHDRKRPALTCMRKRRRGFAFTWEKIRIDTNIIRIFNTAIYNNKLGFMYIKMISTSSGIYWYN